MRYSEIVERVDWKQVERMGLYDPHKDKLGLAKRQSRKLLPLDVRAEQAKSNELVVRRQIQNLMYQNRDLTKFELDIQMRELEQLKNEIATMIDGAELDTESKTRIADMAGRYVNNIE